MPNPREYVFGDASVIIDQTTTARPHGYREFTFRIKRLGKITAYHAEIPIHELDPSGDASSSRSDAEYLLRHASNRRSKLFSYPDPDK